MALIAYLPLGVNGNIDTSLLIVELLKVLVPSLFAGRLLFSWRELKKAL